MQAAYQHGHQWHSVWGCAVLGLSYINHGHTRQLISVNAGKMHRRYKYKGINGKCNEGSMRQPHPTGTLISPIFVCHFLFHIIYF